MSRIHLKKKIIFFKHKKRFNLVAIISLLLIISLVLIFKYINIKVSPIILNYATLEAKKVASVMINSAISKNISNKINIEELFIITKDTNGEIKTIDFDPSIVNSILTETTEIIQNNLKNLEEGNIDSLDLPSTNYLSNSEKLKRGIIFEIPSGVVFGNSFFANLGPKIPVKLSLIGDITSEISTKVTNYGINNALIEIKLNLHLMEQVFLPLSSDKFELKTSVPLTLKLIQGTVPEYYSNGINQNSTPFILPIE